MSALMLKTRVLCSRILWNYQKRTCILESGTTADIKENNTTTVEKNENVLNESSSEEKQQESFATMLRKSKFMQMGCPQNNPQGSILFGSISDIVGDDLYIDFGGKFPCVCKRPGFNPEKYVVGERVQLRVKDLEMTSAFLGSERHITLLEADAVLLGARQDNRSREQSIRRPRKTFVSNISDEDLLSVWKDI